ncbi:MAG: hypothetical protein HC916_12020 [Coleofasciculaceae cyanobacterium SM2_1_6]|nr:hypothetical protein [Coleofasciculaceae cyanobacterium SM2_1_6]
MAVINLMLELYKLVLALENYTTQRKTQMSNLTKIDLLKEVDNLTVEEKIKLIEHLTKQIENQPLKPQQKNLVDLLQNSPLFDIDLDLDRRQEIDHRQVEL